MATRYRFVITGILFFASGGLLAETAPATQAASPVITPPFCVRFYNDPDTLDYYSRFADFTLCNGQPSRVIETYADFPMKFECIYPNGKVVGCGIERRVSPEYCTGTPAQAMVSEGQVLWSSYDPSSIKNCTQQYRATEEVWAIAAVSDDGRALSMDITTYVNLPILETSAAEFKKHGWVSPWYTTEHPQGMTLSFTMRSEKTHTVCKTYQDLPPRPRYQCFNTHSCYDELSCRFQNMETRSCLSSYEADLSRYEYALHHPVYKTVCNDVHDYLAWETERANDYLTTRNKLKTNQDIEPYAMLANFDDLLVVMTDDTFKWYDARMMLHGFRVVLPYWYCDITSAAGAFTTAGIIVDHAVASRSFSKFLSSCKEWQLRPHPMSDSEL